jgi:hypothetical protein
MNEQFEQRLVEPNSGLGKALQYLLRHWHPLTQFLRIEGAPLDNNCCEQALKRAILHRKASMFFKTIKGAEVGDVYMRLIHTCGLCSVTALSDLHVRLQKRVCPVALTRHPPLDNVGDDRLHFGRQRQRIASAATTVSDQRGGAWVAQETSSHSIDGGPVDAE